MPRPLIALGVALGALALLIGGWKLSKSRSFQFYGGLVTRIETRAPLVALTFDDGPTPAGTDAVLPLLDSLGVRATFFVTGREVEQHEAEALRLMEAGHALGNHSYSHRSMVLRSPAFVRREIERTDALIRSVGWNGPIPFRPPYGKRLVVLPRYLHRTGRETVLWDVEPESYPEVARSAEAIAAHVIERVRPGSFVLLHVMYSSREESRRAVPLIVRGLQDRGYQFVTVQELKAARVGAAHEPPVPGRLGTSESPSPSVRSLPLASIEPSPARLYADERSR